MKLIDRSGRIYVPPKRGPLPRKYREQLDDPKRAWRRVAWVLLGCAAVTGVIGLLLK